MKRPTALPPLAILMASIAVPASALDGSPHARLCQGDAKLLIDDRPRAARPAPAPVDVGQDLPADLPNKPPAPTGERGQEIAKLIHELGADDFRARDAAANRLREIGDDALGPLADARNNPDPEVASRAAGIIRRITHHTSLFGRLGQGQNRAIGQRVQVSVGPNGVQTQVFERDHRIEISETPGKITVTVNGTEEGRPVTESVSAGSLAELKAKNPDAAALYERLGANGRGVAGMARLNPGVPMRIGPAGVPGPFIIRGAPNVQLQVVPGVVSADDLTSLRRDTLKRMFEQNLPPEKRAEVLRRFDELADLQAGGGVGAGDEAAGLRRMRTYNDKCDELRKLMAELKLPDPGPALPPPAQARLGITIEGEGPDGVIVGKVLDGSRGARAGLRSGDRILSANGKAIKSAIDLRKLVSGPDKLEITVTRDGAERILEEKPPAAK